MHRSSLASIPFRWRLQAEVLTETRRCFAVYVTGDGWTGSLGTGSLRSRTVGHDDDEETDPPLLLYSGEAVSAAAGWGHTAIITKKKELLICGRPHDFQALLRLNRLPSFVRIPAVEYSLRYNIDQHEREAPSLMGRIFSFMMGSDAEEDTGPWEDARRNSILLSLQQINLPNDDVPSGKCLETGAGLTAIVGEKDGHLYTFGLNHQGQCGVGKSSNNIWTPTNVMGLSTEFAIEGRGKLEQQHPIVSVALGLQHGIALDAQGSIYAWGKGERGQLGQGTSKHEWSEHALRVRDFRLPNVDGRRNVSKDIKGTKIAAGMNHSALLSVDNQVFVWGKNIAPPTGHNEDKNKVALDASFPIAVQGLPEGLAIMDIACGSHHTSMLMEDGSVFAIGVTTDLKEPLFEAIELIEPGVIDMPCRQFAAHFDRTTIVGKDGTQVLQVHLWSEEHFQANALFTPPWVDHFINDKKTIKSVHRGWRHTAIVTD